MINEYVEVVPVNLKKDWILIEENSYHYVNDTQQYLKKLKDKFFLESWYVYTHLHYLKTIKIPEGTNY